MKSPVMESEAEDTSKDVLRIERLFLILAIIFGSIQAFFGRYFLTPDGMSYLDIADGFIRTGWRAVVNGYWSPVYPVLLGLSKRMLRPSLRWEFPVAHILNFVIFVLALFSFRFFLRSAAPWLKNKNNITFGDAAPLPSWVLVGLGNCLFLWGTIDLIDLSIVTPDLLVAALVFLLAGLIMDLRDRHSIAKFAIFGAVAGLAYLTKGIMFPLAFLFLGVLWFSGNSSRTRLGGVLLSAVVFLAVASPFVVALSKSKGRLTYGDTGKLAYARVVSPGSPETNWQGDPEGGVALHPTRQLMDHPPVFEFAEPINGTYPPWYDSSYWSDGLHWRFRLRSQIRVLVQSALTYGKVLEGCAALVAGILIFLQIGKGSTLKAIARNWPLLVVACGAGGIYALVLVKERYIASFAILFWVAILAGVRLPRDAKVAAVSNYIGIAVILTMLMSLTSSVAHGAYRALSVGPIATDKEQLDAAEGLQKMGLRQGDKVAVLGIGTTDYWAYLGKFKIVSQIECLDPGRREFWAASPDLKARAYQSIRSTGARVIVTWNAPTGEESEGWKQISNSNYYVYFFPK
ncbi:MAG: hypothetical protein JWQ87_2936 [Candidatus Sulfotelmatobacter sp.]|nr:hypothetical protein [Candidatus Sulfotelmatobacter sp.]